MCVCLRSVIPLLVAQVVQPYTGTLPLLPRAMIVLLVWLQVRRARLNFTRSYILPWSEVSCT